jgi:membrane protease YdiL (CAAX protease family)
VTPRVVFWATAAALAAFNVARALGAFGRFGDVVGLVVALVIVAVALHTGLDRRAMGLTGDRVRSGLGWGGAAFGLVLAVVVGAALLPATSGFLDDDRARLGAGSLVFEVVVSILLLTVIPEELTFRGVLLGAGSESWGPRKGALASSALFGLWHIAPTLNTAGGNAQLSDAGSTAGGTAAVVVAAVVVTFVAGMIFSWLRLRSGSVLAPMLAHLATNGVTLVVAWFALR